VNLIDSSVWIDYLRGADSRATGEMRRLLTRPGAICIAEPVVMEILAGATSDRALAQLDALTSGLTLVSVDPRLDYRDAATIFRTARRRGRTVRRLNNCLIAAIALRRDVTLVHKDVDFDVLAEVTPLRTLSLRDDEA